jgi:RNA polymerase sigma-70 factor (ECF subfamily)
MDRSDGDLIAAAAAGDRDAFAVLYQRHHLGVYRFARTMTGSTTAAEDVTQEVFLAFMQGLDRYDEGRGVLSTYLYGVARNVSRHRLRKEARLVSEDHQRSRESGPTGAAAGVGRTGPSVYSRFEFALSRGLDPMRPTRGVL